jgi:hypothetical protein
MRLFLALVLAALCSLAQATVGDMKVSASAHSAANLATITVQPGVGEEWLVTTCASSGAFEIDYAVDGSNFVVIDTYGAGSVHGLQWRLRNSEALRIKNVSGGTADFVCQGVQTK